MANALPILLLGGAALMMMGGKKKGGRGVSGLPSIAPADLAKLGPTKSYNPKTGSSSGYPNVSRTKMVEIQNKLVALGFSVGAKGADGLYGPSTKSAVLAFQKKYMPKSAGWDGKPGTKTQAVINSEFSKLPADKKKVAEQATEEGKEEAATKKAPIIHITTDAYYNKFVNTTERAIVCITTTGASNIFQDPKKEALARHNGAVFHLLLEAAAIANAGKMRFALVDLSQYQMLQPKMTKVNGRGFPEFFPMMVGLSGEDDVFGFTMSMDGGEAGIKASTPKMQKLIADVLGAGVA
jgi:peptidoglycan hydrolase-like protein with peptidoglycan-binding domain